MELTDEYTPEETNTLFLKEEILATVEGIEQLHLGNQHGILRVRRVD